MPFNKNSSLNAAFRSSQLAVEKLQSITPVEIASSVSFLKIQRVSKDGQISETPLNLDFQKPPEFGRIAGDRRFGERPLASIQNFSITTMLPFGDITEQFVDIDLIIHRPDALFDVEESQWLSLITPGFFHLIEYGWAGSSNNELINGEGFFDKKTNTLIPSTKKILFSTTSYNFSIESSGEISVKIKGRQNGGYMLRKLYVADIDTEHSTLEENNNKLPNRDIKSNSTNESIRTSLQQRLNRLSQISQKLEKKSKDKFVSIGDSLNILVADTIDKAALKWGYDSVVMEIGDFNEFIPTTTKRYGSKKVANIADLMVPFRSVEKIVQDAIRTGRKITIRNFIGSIVMLANKGEIWASGRRVVGNDRILSLENPDVKVKVFDEEISGKNVLQILIYDIKRIIVKLNADKFDAEKTSRSEVRRQVIDINIPYIDVIGHAQTFISDVNFEVNTDNLIQRVKLDEAANVVKSRQEITSKTWGQVFEEVPEEFHRIWGTLLRGNFSMIGNFLFEAFSQVYLDFEISLWNGFFNILKKVDTISAEGFTTSLEVISNGIDPMKAKKRKNPKTLNEQDKQKLLRENEIKTKNQQRKRKTEEEKIKQLQKK